MWRGEDLYLWVNVGEREYRMPESIERCNQAGRIGTNGRLSCWIWCRPRPKVGGFLTLWSSNSGKAGFTLSCLSRRSCRRWRSPGTSGGIGLDVNASPFHLAWAEVDPSGNLKGHGRVDLFCLIGKTSRQHDNLLWRTAHQVVALAKEKGRAIAIENLKKLPKGARGDGAAELRRRLQQFVYKKFLDRVEVLARREGVEVIKVPAAWSSVVGALKYAPQHGLGKDSAEALVIARRGLGLRDELPENYQKLISDTDFWTRNYKRKTTLGRKKPHPKRDQTRKPRIEGTKNAPEEFGKIPKL